MDNRFPLVNSISSRNRDYVLFLGAGFSKDAGVAEGYSVYEYLTPADPGCTNEGTYGEIDYSWKRGYLKHVVHRSSGGKTVSAQGYEYDSQEQGSILQSRRIRICIKQSGKYANTASIFSETILSGSTITRATITSTSAQYPRQSKQKNSRHQMYNC